MSTHEPADTRPVLVIGVGNEALRDEGVGIHVARALLERDLPPHVRVVEGGTGGWGLVGHLEGVWRLVLVDAMAVGRPPGTVVAVRPEEIRRVRPADRTSLHRTSVFDLLELARALGLEPPETCIVGVEPAEVTWGLELSPALQQALPGAVEAVLQAISYQATAISHTPGATGLPQAWQRNGRADRHDRGSPDG